MFFMFGDQLARFLLIVCTFLVLFGGYKIRSGGAIIEIGDMGAWATLAFLLMVALVKWRSESRAWAYLEKVRDHLLKNGRKYFFWGLGLFFISHFAAHLIRYLTLNTNTWDMGIVHAALHFPYEGTFLSCEICRSGTYLGEHLTFTFALLAPITSFLKSSIFIFALQKAVIVFCLLWMALRGPLKDNPELWTLWLLFVAANQGLRSGLLFDFREDILMYAGLMFCAWGIWKGRGWVVLLASLGVMLSKENGFSSVLMLAPTILLVKETPWSKKERWFWALCVAALSVAYAILSFKFLMPYFIGETGQSKIALLDRFPGMGKTPAELVVNFLKNPIPLFVYGSQFALTQEGLTYVFMLTTVTLFFAWKKWAWLIPALPAFAFNLISAGPGQRRLAYHYDLIIVCWMAFALSLALVDLKKEPAKLKTKLSWGILLALMTFGRSPLYYFFETLSEHASKVKAGWEVQFLHPPEPLATDYFVLANFTHVKQLRIFAPYAPRPEWNRETLVRAFLNGNNMYFDPHGEGRPPQDAKTWAIRGDQPEQAWLITEFQNLGAELIYQSNDTLESSALILFHLPQGLYRAYCEQQKICYEPPQTRSDGTK